MFDKSPPLSLCGTEGRRCCFPTGSHKATYQSTQSRQFSSDLLLISLHVLFEQDDAFSRLGTVLQNGTKVVLPETSLAGTDRGVGRQLEVAEHSLFPLLVAAEFIRQGPVPIHWTLDPKIPPCISLCVIGDPRREF